MRLDLVTIEIGSTDNFAWRFVNYEQRRRLPTATSSTDMTTAAAAATLQMNVAGRSGNGVGQQEKGTSRYNCGRGYLMLCVLDLEWTGDWAGDLTGG